MQTPLHDRSLPCSRQRAGDGQLQTACASIHLSAAAAPPPPHSASGVAKARRVAPHLKYTSCIYRDQVYLDAWRGCACRHTTCCVHPRGQCSDRGGHAAQQQKASRRQQVVGHNCGVSGDARVTGSQHQAKVETCVFVCVRGAGGLKQLADSISPHPKTLAHAAQKSKRRAQAPARRPAKGPGRPCAVGNLQPVTHTR